MKLRMALLRATVLSALCCLGTDGACNRSFPFRKTPTALLGSTDTSGAPSIPGNKGLSDMVLFVGILSSGQGAARREAMRATWLAQLKVAMPRMQHRFVLTREEAKSLTSQELGLQDILVIDAPTGYHHILHKTSAMIQHAARCQADMLFKTDDDTYVHVPTFTEQLHCTLSQHAGHSLFIGYQVTGGKVVTERGHIWWNEEWSYHTGGLQYYLPYHSGAGYLMSGSVARVLAYLQRHLGLAFTRMEDATVGLWVSALNVVWVDWQSVFIPDVKLHKVSIDRSLCGRLPQLAILHKVMPSEMFTLHDLVMRLCQATKEPLAG